MKFVPVAKAAPPVNTSNQEIMPIPEAESVVVVLEQILKFAPGVVLVGVTGVGLIVNFTVSVEEQPLVVPVNV